MQGRNARTTPDKTVALIGTRFRDLEIERAELGDSADIVTSGGTTADEIVTAGGRADVIVAGSKPRFGEEVLEQLNCRAIVRSGIGLDSIDLLAAKRLGYWVVNVPDYGTETVAWHTISLMAAAMRRLLEADGLVREGGWGIDHLRPLRAPSACTLGIIGFGRIGRKVAEIATGIGFGAILAHDAMAVADSPHAELVPLQELLARSDVVTLHAPGEDGEPIIDARRIASMKSGSILVNTSRGSLVDIEALDSSLRVGRIALAALDVFPDEPPVPGLFSSVAGRVILSPHMAWYSEESETDLRLKTAREVRRLLEGEEPLNPVVRPHSQQETGRRRS